MVEAVVAKKVTPLILKDRAILKTGKHNGKNYSLDEVRKAFDFFCEPVTRKTPLLYRNKNSLVMDHDDKVQTVVGDILLSSVKWDDALEGFRGTLQIVDSAVQDEIQHQIDREKETGQPPSFGLSPKINAEENSTSVYNLKIRNVALVLEPAQGCDMFLSLESPDAEAGEGNGLTIDVTMSDLEEGKIMPDAIKTEEEKKAEAAALAATTAKLAADAATAAAAALQPNVFTLEDANKLIARVVELEKVPKPLAEGATDSPYPYAYRKPYAAESCYFPMKGGVEGMSDEEKATLVKDLVAMGKELSGVKLESLADSVKLVWEVLGALPGVHEMHKEKTAEELAAEKTAKDAAEALARTETEKKLSRKGLSGDGKDINLNLKPIDRLAAACAELSKIS